MSSTGDVLAALKRLVEAVQRHQGAKYTSTDTEWLDALRARAEALRLAEDVIRRAEGQQP